MLQIVVRLVIAPFLKGYIWIFGDDPEVIAYAGLAFVIYYSFIMICAAAVYEAIIEHFHADLHLKYYFRRRKIRKRIHRSVLKKKKRQAREERIKMRIRSERGKHTEAEK